MCDAAGPRPGAVTVAAFRGGSGSVAVLAIAGATLAAPGSGAAHCPQKRSSASLFAPHWGRSREVDSRSRRKSPADFILAAAVQTGDDG